MLGSWQQVNQSSEMMTNSSFNLIFGNLSDGSKNLKSNPFMVKSNENSSPLIIENFPIPNLAPQESEYSGLRRNFSNYNRTRNSNSDFYQNEGSLKSNDSFNNLQKNLQDFKLSKSIKSSKRDKTFRKKGGTRREIGWTS